MFACIAEACPHISTALRHNMHTSRSVDYVTHQSLAWVHINIECPLALPPMTIFTAGFVALLLLLIS